MSAARSKKHAPAPPPEPAADVDELDDVVEEEDAGDVVAPSNDAATPTVVDDGPMLLEGIPVSRKVTHWRIGRAKSDGSEERLHHGVAPGGVMRFEWPVADSPESRGFSIEEIKRRWGGGSYIVRFFGYDDGPHRKPFQASKHPLIIPGDGKTEACPSCSEPTSSGVRFCSACGHSFGLPAPASSTTAAGGGSMADVMRGWEMREEMLQRSDAAARQRIRREQEEEREAFERRMQRERQEAEEQRKREREQWQRDQDEREARWRREREIEREEQKKREELPAKVAATVREELDARIGPIEAKIEELDEDDVDDGPPPEGALKTVSDVIGVAKQVIEPIATNTKVQELFGALVDLVKAAAKDKTSG